MASLTDRFACFSPSGPQSHLLGGHLMPAKIGFALAPRRSRAGARVLQAASVEGATRMQMQAVATSLARPPKPFDMRTYSVVGQMYEEAL